MMIWDNKLVVVLFCISSISLSYWGLTMHTMKSKKWEILKFDSQPSPLKFTFVRMGYSPLNSFLDDSDIMKYAIFECFVTVLEPYSEMNLYIIDGTENADIQYSCVLCQYDQSTGQTSQQNCHSLAVSSTSLTSASVKISCKPFDTYAITLTEFSHAGMESQSRESTGYGLCMYVRRDIKTLTTDDTNRTMDAFYTLWSTSEDDGRHLYGDEFHSAQWFSEAHLFNAGQQDSDHIHEGQGFLYQHIKISNMFESALQAVDSSVSLPYWDYSYDAEMLDNVSMSSMFTPATFGSIRFPADGEYWTFANDSILDARIPDGRWQDATAGTYDLFPDLFNSYGLLRGPWNTNPSPYISRFATTASSLPSCDSLYSLANLSTLADFNEMAPYSPHGLTHKTVGGTFGCDVFDELLDDGLIWDRDTKNWGICVNW